MSLTVQQIDDAITAVLTTGQSYSIGGRTFSRASLSELRSLRKEVIQEIATQSRSKIVLFDHSRSNDVPDGDFS